MGAAFAMTFHFGGITSMKKNKTMIFLFILPTVLCLLFMYVYPVVRQLS